MQGQRCYIEIIKVREKGKKGGTGTKVKQQHFDSLRPAQSRFPYVALPSLALHGHLKHKKRALKADTEKYIIFVSKIFEVVKKEAKKRLGGFRIILYR